MQNGEKGCLIPSTARQCAGLDVSRVPPDSALCICCTAASLFRQIPRLLRADITPTRVCILGSWRACGGSAPACDDETHGSLNTGNTQTGRDHRRKPQGSVKEASLKSWPVNPGLTVSYCARHKGRVLSLLPDPESCVRATEERPSNF